MFTHILCGGSPELKPKKKNRSSWQPNGYETMLIKATWSDDSEDLNCLGTEIYMYIFENNPRVKELFPKVHNNGDNWKGSKEVGMQGYLFATVNFLRKIFDILNSVSLRLRKFHLQPIFRLLPAWSKKSITLRWQNRFCTKLVQDMLLMQNVVSNRNFGIFSKYFFFIFSI